MKKISLMIAAVVTALAPLTTSAQNMGIEQLASYSPAPGEISLETTEKGIASMILQFKGGAEVDRTANLFINLMYNGEVISNVPASNTKLVSFDNIMDHVWQISFFPTPSYVTSQPGSYNVIIPEGFFLVGEAKTPNAPIMLNYTIVGKELQILPEEGNNFTSLQDFTVTFGAYVSVEVNPEATGKIEIYNIYAKGENLPTSGPEDEVVNPAAALHPEVTCSGNNAELHLSQKVTEPGTWRVIIPEKYFLMTDASGKTITNEEYIFSYKIPNHSAGLPTIDPETPYIDFFPGVITLTLDKSLTLGMVNEKGGNYIYSVDAMGNIISKVASYHAAYQNSKYYIDPDTKKPYPDAVNKIFLVNDLGEDARVYAAPGMYQLVTAEKLFSTKKDAQHTFISTMTYNYEVMASDVFDMELTPSPKESVSSLKEITVKFPTASNVNITYDVAWLSSDNTNYVFFPEKVENDPLSVKFTTTVPVTKAGKYTFTSAANSVEVDGDLVVVYADYVVSDQSGVGTLENVQTLPAVFDIFNAQGIIVKRNADVDDLRALPAGIYIAGGKKFVNR